MKRKALAWLILRMGGDCDGWVAVASETGLRLSTERDCKEGKSLADFVRDKVCSRRRPRTDQSCRTMLSNDL
jgi:hypothetical protein